MTRTLLFLLDALAVGLVLLAIFCAAFSFGAAFVAMTNVIRACS
ncbi:hypothetical protein [Zavarzinia compransoris]|nr:hypothetical protein [Zavarzinia compransoris]TDP46040.1 hypothetical protein DES42_104121 [Zavarzinia compransoris]